MNWYLNNHLCYKWFCVSIMLQNIPSFKTILKISAAVKKEVSLKLDSVKHIIQKYGYPGKEHIYGIQGLSLLNKATGKKD
ncbi:hypothetical protein Mucpa_0797 [Mucilaginibacter paludis DSM 18603]|uniref:Uncharacterized protein n=1 Tax=Mucilaginibacter paludis DSM 18603 TaxID=714943 RepID=H1Y9Z4_9SPHI|nr:hypothetical protein Mucpa_0797 [Mucilaginibacter paludis DSM 18603]